jgi:hypothetical protein
MTITNDNMREIVDKWSEILDNILQTRLSFNENYNNCVYITSAAEKFLDYAESVIPQLREWIFDYLEKNRQYCWLKYGTDIISKYIANPREYPLPANVDKTWSLFFDKPLISADISFENALELDKHFNNKCKMSMCDDVAILGIHEGKECSNNGWYCDYCEDMSYAWEKKVEQERTSSKNIFLNPILRDKFIQEYMDTYTSAPADWEPPENYGYCYKDNLTYNKYKITSIAEYSRAIREERQRYLGKGLTPVQYLQHFVQQITNSGTGYSILYSRGTRKSDYEIFLILWTLIDVIYFMIDTDRKCTALFKEML